MVRGCRGAHRENGAPCPLARRRAAAVRRSRPAGHRPARGTPPPVPRTGPAGATESTHQPGQRAADSHGVALQAPPTPLQGMRGTPERCRIMLRSPAEIVPWRLPCGTFDGARRCRDLRSSAADSHWPIGSLTFLALDGRTVNRRERPDNAPVRLLQQYLCHCSIANCTSRKRCDSALTLVSFKCIALNDAFCAG